MEDYLEIAKRFVKANVAKTPLDAFIETLKREPKTHATGSICKPGAEMKRETKLEVDFKLHKMPDDHVWVTGDLVQVTSMNGVSVYGVVMSADSLEEAPFKRGRWCWVRTETGEKFVHDSLLKKA